MGGRGTQVEVSGNLGGAGIVGGGEVSREGLYGVLPRVSLSCRSLPFATSFYLLLALSLLEGGGGVRWKGGAPPAEDRARRFISLQKSIPTQIHQLINYFTTSKG